jgi:hypothetical protein
VPLKPFIACFLNKRVKTKLITLLLATLLLTLLAGVWTAPLEVSQKTEQALR